MGSELLGKILEHLGRLCINATEEWFDELAQIIGAAEHGWNSALVNLETALAAAEDRARRARVEALEHAHQAIASVEPDAAGDYNNFYRGTRRAAEAVELLIAAAERELTAQTGETHG